MALPGSGTQLPQKAFPEHHHCWNKAGPQRDVVGKVKEISQCRNTASKAAEAHQQIKDAPACRELHQIHSQFRWAFSPHPLAGMYKSSHAKKHNSKGEKPVGLNTALVWTWARELWFGKRSFVGAHSGFAPLLEGEMGDCSLSAIFAPWASTVRAPGPLQPKETFCPCIHNLGTIRNTNWPIDPSLIYSNFCVKHLIPLLWLLAPNITSYMGLVSSKYHHA